MQPSRRADRQTLTTPETIRAYVHPTRLAILAILADRQETASGVARELGVHPANLTRHLRILEHAGLIRLVEKRDTGRNLAKYYRATATAFHVQLGPGRAEDRRATALGIIRDSLVAAPTGDVVALLATTRIDPARIEALRGRLASVVDEFGAFDDASGIPYSLAVALYPNETALTAPPVNVDLRRA